MPLSFLLLILTIPPAMSRTPSIAEQEQQPAEVRKSLLHLITEYSVLMSCMLTQESIFESDVPQEALSYVVHKTDFDFLAEAHDVLDHGQRVGDSVNEPRIPADEVIDDGGIEQVRYTVTTLLSLLTDR